MNTIDPGTFCRNGIRVRIRLTGQDIQNLLGAFGIRQATLALALQVTSGAISQLVRGRCQPSGQTSRGILILFAIETTCPGYIDGLARGHAAEVGPDPFPFWWDSQVRSGLIRTRADMRDLVATVPGCLAGLEGPRTDPDLARFGFRSECVGPRTLAQYLFPYGLADAG